MNISAFESGLSALLASSLALNRSAQNLANLNTADYKTRRVVFEEAFPRGVLVRETTTASVDVAQEMLQQLKVRRLSDAAIASLKAGEAFLGERLDRRA